MNYHSLELHLNNKHLTNKTDTIDKFYESCGCIKISELDILQNIIIDKYIQICKLHYKQYIKTNKKFNYIFDKKLNKYILSNQIKHKLLKSKSYENVQVSLLKHIHNNSINNLEHLTLLNFGKYKNKTYEYVYYTDKVYCYNLAVWKNIDFKNKKISNFIKFIKKQLLLEYN